jgi:hypothetical protein
MLILWANNPMHKRTLNIANVPLKSSWLMMHNTPSVEEVAAPAVTLDGFLMVQPITPLCWFTDIAVRTHGQSLISAMPSIILTLAKAVPLGGLLKTS